MKKCEFSENDLSPVAFDVYSNSSFVFWKANDVYLYSDGDREIPIILGDLEAVNEFLEFFAEED